MNRLLLYVHFNKYDKVSEHVLYQLRQIRPLYSKLVFISNSQVSAEHQQLLSEQGLFDEFIQRENEGFDFVAWRDGMRHVGWEELKAYDSVTIMNDTCFGPLWDLAPIYQRFEEDATVDFWGMTNHRATPRYKEHLQSYFISFKQQVVQSAEFYDFWDQVKAYKLVKDVIANLETPATNRFQDAGFKYGVVFDTVEEDTLHMALPDFTYYNMARILQSRVPFIKVKAIEGNQQQATFVIDEIAKISTYPIDLIINHMSTIFYPTSNYLLRYKYMEDRALATEIQGRVAIHLHAFYVDLVPDFLKVFASYNFSFDLYITTNEEKKASEIEELASTYPFKTVVKVTGNRGRDVLPMLKLKEDLSHYDYVGHFHTKKSRETEFWAGESWRTELIEMLVKPADQIITHLSQRKTLGLVIADIPTYFRYVTLDPFYEGILSEDMNRLWKEMGLAKDLDFLRFSTYVMSYGTFVWFRYDALKPLFDLNLGDQDVPEEPLPQISVLHAIERMLVYIAWANDYDFLISKNPIALPPFVDINLLNTREGIRFNPVAVPDFTYFGGVRGAIKYWYWVNKKIMRYIAKRLLKR